MTSIPKTLIFNNQSVTQIKETISGIYLNEYAKANPPVVTHDNKLVKFFHDTFLHAFFTTPNYEIDPLSKELLSIKRASLIYWIREIIWKNVPHTNCYEFIEDSKLKRLYVCNAGAEPYIVWLQYLHDGTLKFLTAYPSDHRIIRQKYLSGKKITKIF